MTHRERFIATALFERPDRIPFFPGWARKSTLKAWHNQGLPEGVEWFPYLTEQLGIEAEWMFVDTSLDIDFRMIPQFEEKVIERKAGTLVVQDWKGNVCEISDEFDVSYLRTAIDFVTRRWIKCPVESWEDWEEMKARYDPDEPARFPADFKDRCRNLAGRDRVAGLQFNGPFMQLREWLGFEGLCMALIEQRDLVQDMLGFWRDFIARIMEKVFDQTDPDFVHVSEDMAYKEKAMISPAMTRELWLPVWQDWHGIVESAGCPVYDVDSDGYVGELIPIWIDAGFNVCDPIEVAAGNDLGAFRGRFGKRIAYSGGVDKRAMAKGGDAIQAEMARAAAVVKSCGYIPSCDHAIPSDVSWPAMIEYSRLLAQITGWL